MPCSKKLGAGKHSAAGGKAWGVGPGLASTVHQGAPSWLPAAVLRGGDRGCGVDRSRLLP